MCNSVPHQVAIRFASFAATSALSWGDTALALTFLIVLIHAHASVRSRMSAENHYAVRNCSFPPSWVRTTHACRTQRRKADVWRGFLREILRLGLYLRNSPFQMQKLCRTRAVIFFMQKCRIALCVTFVKRLL